MTISSEASAFPKSPFFDDATALPRPRSAASKIALLLLSVGLIGLIAGRWQTPAFIFAMVTIGWVAITAGDRLIVAEHARRIVAGGAVAGAMVAIIVANMSGLLGTLTGTPATLQNQWPLLLGVTFYALQVAGVASDVLRREIARPTLLSYLVFILLGFKFYSGPLERANDLDRIVNWIEPRTADAVWEGFSWTLLGIFMKFVIANPMSELIELNTTNPISTLAVATIAELRIYFDFAGYSFMAVGIARLAGVQLTNNFRQPLFASSLPDFWRRWHVSFGNWLRHYIYIPLRTGMRERKIPTVLLAPSIFIISAIWHGGTVNFAIWGAVHALAFWLFVSFFSKHRWSPLTAHLTIIALLIFVRLIYIDADTERLLSKLADFRDPSAWVAGIASLSTISFAAFPTRVLVATGLALGFLVLEGISLRVYGTHDYRLLRTLPAMAVILVLTLLLIYSSPSAIFVYARH